MAYSEHTLFVMGGTIHDDNPDAGPDQSDIWTCNIRLDNGSGDPVADPAAFLALIVGAMASWYGDSDSGMASTSSLDFMKANSIGTDGKYLDTSSTHAYYWGTPVAGGSSPAVPSYISLCYSWGTSRDRGPGSRGRIYPPNYTYSAAGTAFVATAARNAAWIAASQLLAVLYNEDISRPVIASGVDASLTPISRQRVGARYDVQRRRENALSEFYTPWAAFPG